MIDQAVSIAQDARTWVFENFKLSDEQAEYYKSIPEDFNYFLGWQIASAVIGRQPIKLGAVPAEASKQNKKKNTDVSIKGNTDYNPSTGQTTYGFEVGVTFHF